MAKITFRADDDLVNAVETLEESKSEVMRDALRAYLEAHADSDAVAQTLDDVVAARVDEHVAGRFGESARDVNVTIAVEAADGARAANADREPADSHERDAPTGRQREPAGGREPELGAGGQRGGNCPQCGESVAAEHAFCPNCGEQASRRLFCECGDEIRADWSFCPHCGRRTASVEALDQ